MVGRTGGTIDREMATSAVQRFSGGLRVEGEAGHRDRVLERS